MNKKFELLKNFCESMGARMPETRIIDDYYKIIQGFEDSVIELAFKDWRYKNTYKVPSPQELQEYLIQVNTEIDFKSPGPKTIDDLFGNKKYIPDEAEYLLNEAMALSVVGLISPDASAIGRRIGRTIKRYALTKSQYERYSVAKSYAPGSFSLEDLYLIKNTNLTPDKIANYAIENQGKDKIKIYKRYKKEGVF